MHKTGWKFVKVSGLGVYHFEKCTPQDVVYQLDYNKNGLTHKDEYLKMFDDCGWEYMQDYFDYIFLTLLPQFCLHLFCTHNYFNCISCWRSFGNVCRNFLHVL